MKYRNILITGGAGFVGSNLALQFKKEYSKSSITCLDNLIRKGSELNVPRLKKSGIRFIQGDIRYKKDLDAIKDIELIIECAADPSVLAGVNESPEYVIGTNTSGAVNCFELARIHGADVIFLSTSRVYPLHELNQLLFKETQSRFELAENQKLPGVSANGITEDFPTGTVRSMYGTSKLAAEQFLQEYIAAYKIKGVINRCGVITGPWQMGKIDQGVIVLWLARHIWQNKPLSYIGYGGKGKQVRDFMHIGDLYEALKLQINNLDVHNGEIYNIGGGVSNSLSLAEMTQLCRTVTGHKIPIKSEVNNRENDIRIYISDCSKFQNKTGWKCTRNAERTFNEIYEWIMSNKKDLEPILN